MCLVGSSKVWYWVSLGTVFLEMEERQPVCQLFGMPTPSLVLRPVLHFLPTWCLRILLIVASWGPCLLTPRDVKMVLTVTSGQSEGVRGN